MPWHRALLEAVFQPRCVACDRVGVLARAPMCAACAASLDEVGAACPACAEPTDGEHALRCRRCVSRPPATDGVIACWRYGGAIAEALRRLKFQRATWIARALAPTFAPQLRAVCALTAADVVTFVPLHWRRRAWRGFDQGALLAGLAAVAPVTPTLRRVRRTAAQSRLPARAPGRQTSPARSRSWPARARRSRAARWWCSTT
jgi:predicted amidophosphoribosyltransferase